MSLPIKAFCWMPFAMYWKHGSAVLFFVFLFVFIIFIFCRRFIVRAMILSVPPSTSWYAKIRDQENYSATPPRRRFSPLRDRYAFVFHTWKPGWRCALKKLNPTLIYEIMDRSSDNIAIDEVHDRPFGTPILANSRKAKRLIFMLSDLIRLLITSRKFSRRLVSLLDNAIFRVTPCRPRKGYEKMFVSGQSQGLAQVSSPFLRRNTDCGEAQTPTNITVTRWYCVCCVDLSTNCTNFMCSDAILRRKPKYRIAYVSERNIPKSWEYFSNALNSATLDQSLGFRAINKVSIDIGFRGLPQSSFRLVDRHAAPAWRQSRKNAHLDGKVLVIFLTFLSKVEYERKKQYCPFSDL